MSLHETNRDILAALSTVMDLPPRIRELTLTLGMDELPRLTISAIVLRSNGEEKPSPPYVSEKRYRLVAIDDGVIDVTTMLSTSRQFEKAPPV